MASGQGTAPNENFVVLFSATMRCDLSSWEKAVSVPRLPASPGSLSVKLITESFVSLDLQMALVSLSRVEAQVQLQQNTQGVLLSGQPCTHSWGPVSRQSSS